MHMCLSASSHKENDLAASTKRIVNIASSEPELLW